MRRKKEMNWRSSRTIWTLSLFCFAVAAISMLLSTYYMNRTIDAEEEAQIRRAEYKQLGENLADASDYLTEEVRFFAVTGEIVHCYNYWEEIFHTRQREKAIAAFEKSQPPEEEKKLLDEAKSYSDLLVETESISMKLVLLSEEKTPSSYTYDAKIHAYVTFLMSVELPKKYEKMAPKKMRDAAVSMLYDAKYEAAKRKIMQPIKKFQKQMNQRLEKKLEQRKEETRIATILQRTLIGIELLFVAALLYVMNGLYIRPLKSYTQQISEAGVSAPELAEHNQQELSIWRAKIVPYGSAELIQFAQAFNEMIDLFFCELRQRKNAEESMRKARNEAQIANEAKSTFLAQMSHELRTPLNAVNGYTFLLEKTPLKKKQLEYLNGIHYSANGLLELINQILDFSKIESGNLQWENITFDLLELLREIKAMFAPQAAQKGLFFQIEVQSEGVFFLQGDPVRLRQILVNLIGNALKFTESGEVTVKVRLEEKQAYHCVFYFEVKDSGIGISEEAKERIFQPFTQSDASITRKYGGTGLGLPICQKLIAEMGEEPHELNVESEPQKGTTFFFTMDFPYRVENPKKSVDDSGKMPDCGGKKVLLVDDNEINRTVQKEILGLCHLTVQTADSGKAAIEYLKTEAAVDVELIFMDIRMPDMDGYEATRQIRKMSDYANIPIIALTADVITQVKENAQKVGMNDCLLKPLQQDRLFRLLANYFPVTWKEEKEVQPEEEIVQNLDTFPLFEKETCLKQLNGNQKAMCAVIQRFLQLHADETTELSHLLLQKQYQKAAEEVHKIKGVAGNLCCRRLYECCKEFQIELEERQSVRLPEYICIWEETCKELKKALPHKELEQQPIEHNRQENLEWFKQAYQYSQDADTEAVMILEEHIKELEKMCDAQTVQTIKEALIQFDFEQLEESLHCFMNEQRGERQKCIK